MKRRTVIVRMLAGALMTLVATGTSHAQEPFYKGKTIRIIHGFGTGGGFDTSARTVARHLTDHVPGNPEFVVESMPGAASLVAMNYVYNKAKPDGLTMGLLSASLLVDEALGAPGIQFDSKKFKWLGAPSSATPICTIMTKSGIKTADDWKNAKTPLKIGATSPGSEVVYASPRTLQTEAKFPMQIIVGHKGGNPALKLAALRGEIDGFCSSLEAANILMHDALKSGEAHIVIQLSDKPDPAIPNIPLAKDYVQTKDGAALIRVAVAGPQRLNRVFAFPPGTSDDKVAIMRKALAETYRDPAFLADAKKVKMNVNPVLGDESEHIIQQIGVDASKVHDRLKAVLLPH
jgi:tripartite-type tricarboxylate transporter receptor subunit TctC